jgi:hypothetical protein
MMGAWNGSRVCFSREVIADAFDTVLVPRCGCSRAGALLYDFRAAMLRLKADGV